MSMLVVQSIEGPDDNANRFPDGLSVTGITTLASAGGITTTGGTLYAPQLSVSGVITATSFSGSGASLTGTGIAGINTTGFSTFKDVKHSGITTCVGIVSCSDVVATGIITAKAFIPDAAVASPRNLLQNGAFNVAQRGTSSTTAGFYTVDRWQTNWTGANEAPTTTQHDLTSSDTGPWGEGFKYSWHVQNGNQTSVDAGDEMTLNQPIMARTLAQSGWDYNSTSSYVTLSFWVKSSVAQKFYGRLQTIDGTDYNYPFEISNSGSNLSADTWTKIIKKIPGNSNLQIDNNTGRGANLMIVPFYGTDFTNDSVANDTWAEYAGGTMTKDYTDTWWDTDDATFEITGVQLEVGEVATPFEHRLYQDELFACKYFFERVNGAEFLGATLSYQNNRTFTAWHWSVEKRSVPGVSIDDGTEVLVLITSGYNTASATTFDTITVHGCRVQADSGSTPFTTGDAALVELKSGNFIDINSEY